MPTAYFSWNRDSPSVRIAQAIFAATVSGEPTNSEPVGPAPSSNCSGVYGPQPRSLPILVNASAWWGYICSRASSSVAATWPGLCIEIGRVECS